MRRNYASNLKVVGGRLEPKHRPQRLRGESKPRLYTVKFGGVRSPSQPRNLRPDKPAVPEDKTPKGTAKPFVHSGASRAIFRFLERTAKV